VYRDYGRPQCVVVVFPDGTSMDVFPPPWDYDHEYEEQKAFVKDVLAPVVWERKLTGDIVPYACGI